MRRRIGGISDALERVAQLDSLGGGEVAPRWLHGRQQLRPPAQYVQRAHTLQIHRQNMDVRARPVHRSPDPLDARIKHLNTHLRTARHL